MRRVAAVRIAVPVPGENVDFVLERFVEDLNAAWKHGYEVELIEAKRKASRYTIGQAIDADDLLLETYDSVPVWTLGGPGGQGSGSPTRRSASAVTPR